MDPAEQAAVDLIIIVIAAFLLPLAAGWARMPAVVLEILFGILVGPIFGIVDPAEFLDRLADFGFLLLMFLAGFEIDVRTFTRRGVGQAATALGIFVLTFGAAYSAAHIIGYGFFMTFVLATTSVGLVVPTLRSTRRTGTRLGQVILVSAVLADFLTLLGVAVFALVEEHGAGLRLLLIPGFLAAVTFGLMGMRRLVWWKPEWFERMFQIDDPEELGTRASLAIMLVFVGIAIAFGIETILGAFIAGTGFALVFRNRGTLGQQLSGFSYGFLIPVFFVNVGINFELEALGEPGAIRNVFVLLAAAVLVKTVPSLLLVLRRHSLREALAAGALLSARLSLIIAVAELGVRLGVIDRVDEASIIVLAAMTATLAPIVFRSLLPPLSNSRTADSADPLL